MHRDFLRFNPIELEVQMELSHHLKNEAYPKSHTSRANHFFTIMTLAQLTDQDFDKMATEIQRISRNASDDDLYTALGKALDDLGYTVSSSKSFEIIHPKMFGGANDKISMLKSYDYVANVKPVTRTNANKEGKKFWKRFKDKLQKAICNDPKIKELMTGNGTLQVYLITGIPLVLAALGLGVLNPVTLAIIAAVFALILKVGFEAYCEI